jgi:hypothetical protein
MTIADRFGATVEVTEPDATMQGTFFIKRRPTIPHESFMISLLGALDSHSELVMHHQSGFAVVQLPYGRAQGLKRLPGVDTVGGIQLNLEQFRAVTGTKSPG